MPGVSRRMGSCMEISQGGGLPAQPPFLPVCYHLLFGYLSFLLSLCTPPSPSPNLMLSSLGNNSYTMPKATLPSSWCIFIFSCSPALVAFV